MKNTIALSILCALTLCITVQAASARQSGSERFSVTALRAGYLPDPIGIGETSPLLSWEMEMAYDSRGVMQTSYRIVAARSKADVEAGRNLVWDSGKVTSDRSAQIAYGGPAQKSRERIFWRVKVWNNKGGEEWSPVASFEAGLLNKTDWKALWITPNIKEDTTKSPPAQYLRKEFKLPKKVKQARAYVSAQGIFELRINGRAVGDEMFAPGWTSYGKRIQYRAYDITALLSTGANAVGVMLGDGWYRGYLRWMRERNHFGNTLAALVQIEVTYTDGVTAVIFSDPSWRSTNEGPILMSDLYNGETYDANRELGAWDRAGYDDSRWSGVRTKEVKAEVVASESVPVRVIRAIKPVRKIITPKNETVLDFGQNILGVVEFRLSAPKGSSITLKFGEVLDGDGNFYNENMRTAKAEDTYIFKGVGAESFRPQFTFHGFQFMKIEDYTGEVNLKDFTALVITSDVGHTGSFSCSDTLINKLQSNIQWSLWDNFLDIPTDCPQRDERLGWTGDAQAIAPTACFNVDACTFWKKWLKDLALDQYADGRVPDVIPTVIPRANGAAGWADAAVIVPWTVYTVYGDTGVLRDQYKSMKAWVEYQRNNSDSNLIRAKQYLKGRHYGDWLAYTSTDPSYPGATTDKDLLSTAFFAYSADLLSRSAKVLGNSADAAAYRKLFEDIRASFQREFITSEGRLASNTQTAYVLALYFGLVPDNLAQRAADRLAADVKSFGHITTGFLGTPLICHVLSMYGHDDTAYMLLFRKKFPSWLYPVTMGATTIWERWDAILPNGKFNSVGMNSFNHYAYGAIGDWLYSRTAGLRQQEGSVAYKKIHIEPAPNAGLTHAEASYKSIYGAIYSGWKTSGGVLTMKVVIPANTSAKVYIPSSDTASVKEGGKLLDKIKDIKVLGQERGKTVVEIGSGVYEFICPYANK